MTEVVMSGLGPEWKHMGYMKDGFDSGGVLSGKMWATTTASESITWKSEKSKWLSIVGDGEDQPVDPSKCPHCRRDWHPEPLTQDVAGMLETHKFRLDYNPETDVSDVVCVGANYCGPNRPPRTRTYETGTYFVPVVWDSDTMKKALKSVKQMNEAMNALIVGWITPGVKIYGKDWKPLIPEKEVCELPDNLPTVEFGPQNWIPSTKPVHTSQHLQDQVLAYWADFNRNDFPVPERPGIDFSAYATDEISYPTSGKKAGK